MVTLPYNIYCFTQVVVLDPGRLFLCSSKSLWFDDAHGVYKWSKFHLVLMLVVRSGELFWCLSFLILPYNFIFVPDPTSLTRDVWRRVRYFPSSGLRFTFCELVTEAFLPVVFIWWESHLADKIISDLSLLVINRKKILTCLHLNYHPQHG